MSKRELEKDGFILGAIGACGAGILYLYPELEKGAMRRVMMPAAVCYFGLFLWWGAQLLGSNREK